jgi:ergothioneine biosynthesis protein EgtB
VVPALSELLARFRAVRARTTALAAPLSAEDQVVQPMADASPIKWHLAHTTWFFEAIVLGRDGAAAFDAAFGFLFNSYYEAIGSRVARPDRGRLTRPSLEIVHRYREAIDRQIERALVEGALDAPALSRLELGLHHEQQHQELILTDAKVTLGMQPLRPAYRDDLAAASAPAAAPPAPGWCAYPGGLVEIGAIAKGFAFDNERPRHRVYVAPYQLAVLPIRNSDVLAFVADGGYGEPRLWLADGWAAAREHGWELPMYWARQDGGFVQYGLGGVRPVVADEPACHLSYYEVDAIARWLGARLPTEAEWELAAAVTGGADLGHFADTDRLHPAAAPAGGEGPVQLFGDVWEWTASSYGPYPGFRPLSGALAEYNGKFMSGQQVLRGGSCLTPRDHIRATYRNFFPPPARWQMTGARIARDA